MKGKREVQETKHQLKEDMSNKLEESVHEMERKVFQMKKKFHKKMTNNERQTLCLVEPTMEIKIVEIQSHIEKKVNSAR